MHYPTNILSIIKRIAPGIPSSPMQRVVIKFKPIWNPKEAKEMFIRYIRTPPSIEFIIIFNTFLIGTINNLPIKNKKHIHAKNVSKVLSKLIPPKKKIVNYITIFMNLLGQLFLSYILFFTIKL